MPVSISVDLYNRIGLLRDWVVISEMTEQDKEAALRDVEIDMFIDTAVEAYLSGLSDGLTEFDS